MTKDEALYNFWNSFGIEMYPINAVPEDTTFPWGTYEVIFSTFGNETTSAVHLYFHTDSEKIPNSKAEEICNYIGFAGVRIPFDDGFIWIKLGIPSWYSSASQDITTKHRFINTIIEVI